MIVDNEATLTSTVAFDLETVNPGPGKPLKMYVAGMTAGNLAITHCATTAGTYTACTTVTVNAGEDLVEFELPSNTKQFIKATFTTGSVNFSMTGVQTAK